METGEVFKYYRENKGFSITKASKDIVTPQFLRKFENGSSDISYTNLLLLLGRIGVTITEFVKLDDLFDWNTFLTRIEDRMSEASIKGSSLDFENLIAELVNLTNKSDDKRFYLISIVIKNYYHRIILNKEFTRENIEELEVLDYLRGIDYWTSCEYFLATNISLSLTTEELLEKCKLIFDKEIAVTCSNGWILDYIVHLPVQLIYKGDYELANYIIDTYLIKVASLNEPTITLFDLYARYVKGILLLQTDASAGEEKCRRIIDIFAKDLENTFYANRLNINFIKIKKMILN